jgi:hypothetical protein
MAIWQQRRVQREPGLPVASEVFERSTRMPRLSPTIACWPFDGRLSPGFADARDPRSPSVAVGKSRPPAAASPASTPWVKTLWPLAVAYPPSGAKVMDCDPGSCFQLSATLI